MDYVKHATAIAKEIGLTVIVAKAHTQTAPRWAAKGEAHGIKYRVTLGMLNGGKASLRFDFWDSIANCEADKEPTIYDILACISSDASMSTDPDEIAQEFGIMKPSQAIAIAAWAKKLQAFFTEDEREKLNEIQ